MRYWLFIGALLTCIVLLFLTSVSAESPLLSRHYTELVLLGIALCVFLFLLVIYQLVALIRERRKHIFGSRLTTRLVILLASTAFFPGVILYMISVHFIAHSIDSWFDTHIETAIQSGVSLGKNVLSEMLRDLLYHGQQFVPELSTTSSRDQKALLSDFIEKSRLTSAMITDTKGRVLSFAIIPGALFTYSDPSAEELSDAVHHHGYVHAEPLLDNGLGLRAIIPFFHASHQRFLILSVRISDAISRTLNEIQDINGDYMRLSLARHGLLWVYQVSLTLAILLALLIAINMAIYYSKRLSSPLIMLARGTEAVAQGDLSPREISGGRDELSILTRSFNTMIAQLSEARQSASQNSAQLAAEKEYLGNLLSQISTGVMTFDQALVLRLANDSAREILDTDFKEVEGLPLTAWKNLSKEFTDAVLTGFTQDHPRTAWRKEVVFDYKGHRKCLLVRGSYLRSTGEGQWIVVFDDVTQIIHAQKMIAWGEVAQRLAHEIKNPLTPIQLCAERLQVKLGPSLVGADRALLEKMSQMIITQVSAMKGLIDDFRSLSRLPSPVLASFCLNQLLEEVLEPYMASFFTIRKEGFEEKIMVVADIKQMRQVFLNLISNAEEAFETPDPKAEVVVSLYQDASYAYCSISDNGPGFFSDVMMKAFEPYITTKKRGTGLGLAIVKKIVDDHNAIIRIENRTQGGARVTVGFSKSM